MRTHSTMLAMVLLLSHTGLAQGEPPATQPAAPPFDAAKTAGDLATQIKPHLPANWSLLVDKDTITITRKEPVEWFGNASLPTFKDKADLKAQGFVQSSTYTVIVKFASPLTPAEAENLEKQNLRMVEDYYQTHPVKPRRKPTSPPTELTQRLHPIPNVLTPEYSAFVTPFLHASEAFFSDEDGAECRRVEQAVLNVLKP